VLAGQWRTAEATKADVEVGQCGAVHTLHTERSNKPSPVSLSLEGGDGVGLTRVSEGEKSLPRSPLSYVQRVRMKLTKVQ
jgi:hypothetical protein